MNITAHSEVGRIKTLYIKRAAAAFVDQETIDQQWQALNFEELPRLDQALVEYEKLESILKKYSDEIYFLPENNSLTLDSIYCRDASIATNEGMILCRMGKRSRAGEPSAQQNAFEKNEIPVMGVIRAPGTLEGGDTAWLDRHTLAVGHSYRTNREGISQLRSLLETIGVDLVVADLPHFRGPGDVFHLMSIFSPITPDRALVYSPLMPISFRQKLQEMKYKLIEIPEKEFMTMGCNVLALDEKTCLVVSGNHAVRSLLESEGFEVIEYPGMEISVKGGGGPTCLTRPLNRYQS
ncbi:MAG TPA: arginine deiminase family protein [Puia sp.]|nr:arginine deiminase family protein [Puia sp.]